MEQAYYLVVLRGEIQGAFKEDDFAKSYAELLGDGTKVAELKCNADSFDANGQTSIDGEVFNNSDIIEAISDIEANFEDTDFGSFDSFDEEESVEIDFDDIDFDSVNLEDME